MPSPLETLVKILKLEREQGYNNTAVIGGLGAYSANWVDDAHQNARKPEHHKLVDELYALLQDYENIDSPTERHDKVTYMMNRIMGRVPAPPEYQVQPEDEQQTEHPQQRHDDADTQEETTSQAAFAEADGEDTDEDDDDEDYDEEDFDSDDDQDGGDDDDERSSKRRSSRREHSSRRSSGSSWAERGPRRSEPDIPPQPKLARPPRKRRQEVNPEEAADILRGLKADVQTVKGVGPSVAQALNRLGIETINDLLFFLPRRYDDYTQLDFINRLQPDKVATVIGSVRLSQVREGSNGRKYFYMELDDGSGVLSVTFFGQPYLAQKIRQGKQLVLRGKTSIYRNRLQMNNPEWEELDSRNLHTTGIVPVYPLTEGLGAKSLRTLMKKTVDYWAERLIDYIPEATLERAELGDLGWAISNLHFPEGQDHLHHARSRYIFDQLLLLQLAILANRRDWQSEPGQPLDVTDEFLESFIDTVFPYPLTSAQRRAIDDIRRDIAKDVPMNRLLQGDVGAGKTAVAVTALAMAFACGKQGAMMAPTSILAEQHYRGISTALEAMPGDRKPVVGMLTSALTTTEREAIYNGLADGSIDIVIGTHALIQQSVEFNDLAVAIIDEQHRFGVEQRGALRGKGTNPHLLVMTATPIPRTLALTMYADLDLSVMDEKPPGRKEVQTRIVHPVERERIYSFVESQLEQGRQAFVVHPLVEASDKIEAKSATEAYEELSQVFFRYRVGLLHGRMSPVEKDDVMAAFAAHEFDVLVTTSVAEVGVDIPNASVIVIEGANRFGLAQLHQFRGRVGRGEHASYCLLIPDNVSAEAEERLRALEDTTDGFKLAETDWKMRGAGDLIGTKQSGRNTLQLMEAMTPQLVELAQKEARTIYEEDPYLNQEKHMLLAQRVNMLYNEESDVS